MVDKLHTTGERMDLVKRILNELPSLVVLALTIAGVDQVEYGPVVEFAGAAGTFGTWLLARRKIDGPVTVLSQHSG